MLIGMLALNSPPLIWIAFIAIALFLGGCGEPVESNVIIIEGPDEGVTDAEVDAQMMNDTCDRSMNGWCDEPALCMFGTDDTDCWNACRADEPPLAFIAAACAHRAQLEPVVRPSINERQTADLWTDETLPAPTPNGGMEARHYRVFVPPGLHSDALVPLVLMLPGNRVSHYSGPDYTELDRTATREGFVVVYVEQPWRSETFSWSWYTDWDWANDADGNPDVRFLELLVEHLTMTRPVDPQRVYVSGHSRGGAMSFIAALERPEIFAGSIPQSGFVEFGYFDRIIAWEGEVRPAFYVVHGTIDDDVCVDCRPGGNCGIQPSRRCGTVASSDAIVEALMERGWNENNLRYARLENVAHRWQPWLNETWWQFMQNQRRGGQ